MEEEKICDMILNTRTNITRAQNIGIQVLDNYEGINVGLVPKLREIAFYVQSLARGYDSQQHRADECYAKYNKSLELTGEGRGIPDRPE